MWAQHVVIGEQVWMLKNLDVSTFRNGDSIMQAKSANEWKLAGDRQQPAWCYYDNDAKKNNEFGKLYNCYAVNDPRGLAPVGWHIPNVKEWNTLVNDLGQSSMVSYMLKSERDWGGIGGTNESGFTGLPAGHCETGGLFFGLKKNALWWSLPEVTSDSAHFIMLNYTFEDVIINQTDKRRGLSVRCVMNEDSARKIIDTAKLALPNDVDSLLALSTSLEEEGDDIGSLRLLLKVIKIDPNNTEALLRAGLHYQRLNQFMRSRWFFSRLIEEDPNNAMAYCHASYSALKVEDFNSAIRHVEQSLELSPDNPCALKNRALIYLAQGRKELACDDLKKSIELGFTEMYGNEAERLLERHCGQ